MVGTLKVQRHRDHGWPVILIRGLEGGAWVWPRTFAQLQRSHVVYAVTLAGFDGVPAPSDGGNLFDRADAPLLQRSRQDRIDKPALVGHSRDGTLALSFAGERAERISGVVAVDGLPIFPGMERISVEQRRTMAAQMQQQISVAIPKQVETQVLHYMQHVGLVDQQLAARHAPMNSRSDIKPIEEYMVGDLGFDGRPGLKHASVPILEISPYCAPDFSKPDMAMSEAQKAAYCQSPLANVSNAKVVSIASSRHYVMLDQPLPFQQVLDGFLKSP